MKSAYVAILGSLVGLTVSSSNAATISSTYADTQSCRTIEEGEDLFSLRCHAPAGNVSAVLSYWDGRAFATYEPFFSNGSVKASHRKIANNAQRAFGQKLEWRIRSGEKQPCAAIIRVFSTKAGVLVVNDLADGKHLGDAKTNEQARKLADKACFSDRRGRAVAVQSNQTVPTPLLSAQPTEIIETVAQAASRGEKAFARIYYEDGIVGAIDELKSCYASLQAEPSVSRLSYCAAIDILASNIDALLPDNYPKVSQGYFGRGLETDKRITNIMHKLGLDEQERSLFDQQIIAALGLVNNDSSGTETVNDLHKKPDVETSPELPSATNDNKPKSVFDFQ